MRKCLACGQDMTMEEWYPEMLCDSCRQDIDKAFTAEKGMEYQNGYD